MNVRVEAAGAPIARERARALDLVALMKLRLNLLVLGAAATGYVLAAQGTAQLLVLAPLIGGVLLAGSGASALNMALEGRRDRLMERTRNRPVAAGRMTPEEALRFGAMLAAAGVLMVTFGCNVCSGALCAATVLLYVLVYTPLKTRTVWNTWVGAVPGALPPLIGWSAATGSVDPAALSLFGIVFLWQFPHFFAIASIHRADYARGGFAMLPVLDDRGFRTAHAVLITALAMVPVSLLPAVFRIAGPTYFVGAFGLAMVYLVFSARAALLGVLPAWKDLLRVSLVCLPGLFVLMLVDRLPL